MNLEKILRTPAQFVFTKHGTAGFAENAGELGKYKREAQYVFRLYHRFLKNQGMGLAAFLGRDKEYIEKHLHGVGVVRVHPSKGRVVAMMYGRTADERYILGNGLGSFSEGIDGIVSKYKWSRNEAMEYVLSEETTHLARPNWSESKVAEAMFRWYVQRAKSADEHTQHRYMNMAEVANKRYQMHRKQEGQKAKDLFDKHKVKRPHHEHNGHGGQNKHNGHEAHNGHNGHGHHVKSSQHYKSQPAYQSKAQASYKK